MQQTPREGRQINIKTNKKKSSKCSIMYFDKSVCSILVHIVFKPNTNIAF